MIQLDIQSQSWTKMTLTPSVRNLTLDSTQKPLTPYNSATLVRRFALCG